MVGRQLPSNVTTVCLGLQLQVTAPTRVTVFSDNICISTSSRHVQAELAPAPPTTGSSNARMHAVATARTFPLHCSSQLICSIRVGVQ